MPHVICQPCIETVDTSCVDACPYDAIHPTSGESDFSTTDQLFIDPSRCLNCGLCADACPVGAIYKKENVPSYWANYITKNANHFR